MFLFCFVFLVFFFSSKNLDQAQKGDLPTHGAEFHLKQHPMLSLHMDVLHNTLTSKEMQKKKNTACLMSAL